MIKLSKRMEAVASYVGKGSIVADVGTDHAYIPIYLILNGICERCIATDIKEGPMNRARASAEEYGVSDKIRFLLTDGLKGIGAEEYDTVIIAGMGGESIIKIMEASGENKRYILQPMTKRALLCEFLYKNNYCIENELLCEDTGTLYNVLLVNKGSGIFGESRAGYYAGSKLFENRDPLLMRYLETHISRLKRALEGAERGGENTNPERFRILLEEFNEMKERINW